MKTSALLLSLILLAATLSGCSGESATAAPPIGNPETVDTEGSSADPEAPLLDSISIQAERLAYLAQDYPNALSLRNQLIVGTFLLEETEWMITPQQAGELLPLW